MNGSVYLFALVLLLGLAVCLAYPMETMGEDRRAVIWGNQGSAHKNEALGALQLQALLERYRATPQDGRVPVLIWYACGDTFTCIKEGNR